ncbi:hypothetical protein M9H77_02989 [Catharanthus roseus]|uniref:Uncharacterized protein n=1 Tax=Catharanthus roseus TaxID=4058 RepID=A0ACC0CAG6_CATRO|nr:hypothetical protein M9H77_02989 [Catharanthus roseus]
MGVIGAPVEHPCMLNIDYSLPKERLTESSTLTSIGQNTYLFHGVISIRILLETINWKSNLTQVLEVGPGFKLSSYPRHLLSIVGCPAICDLLPMVALPLPSLVGFWPNWIVWTTPYRVRSSSLCSWGFEALVSSRGGDSREEKKIRELSKGSKDAPSSSHPSKKSTSIPRNVTYVDVVMIETFMESISKVISQFDEMKHILHQHMNTNCYVAENETNEEEDQEEKYNQEGKQDESSFDDDDDGDGGGMVPSERRNDEKEMKTDENRAKKTKNEAVSKNAAPIAQSRPTYHRGRCRGSKALLQRRPTVDGRPRPTVNSGEQLNCLRWMNLWSPIDHLKSLLLIECGVLVLNSIDSKERVKPLNVRFMRLVPHRFSIGSSTWVAVTRTVNGAGLTLTRAGVYSFLAKAQNSAKSTTENLGNLGTIKQSLYYLGNPQCRTNSKTVHQIDVKMTKNHSAIFIGVAGGIGSLKISWLKASKKEFQVQIEGLEEYTRLSRDINVLRSSMESK